MRRQANSAVAWIIAAIVLLAVIGPVLYLLPSKRQRRLGALRAAARSAGLAVELASVPKLDAAPEERVSAGGVPRDARIDCAAYRLPLPKPLPDAPCWRLLKCRSVDASRPHPIDGWTALSPPQDVPTPNADYWRRVAACIDALPGGCVGVEANGAQVGWLGTERLGDAVPEDVVADIRSGLEALRDLHVRIAGQAGPQG